MNKLQVCLGFAVVAAITMAGSGCNKQIEAPAEKAPTAQSPTGPAQLNEASAKSTVSLVAPPTLSQDGSAIQYEIAVKNEGGAEFATAGTNPVNIGNQTVDASGKVNTEFVRTPLPSTIASGTSANVKVSVPADGAYDKKIRVLLVQEGVNWFDAWGQKPVEIGPITKCGADICNDGKPMAKQ